MSERFRKKYIKNESPRVGVIDSQSVKTNRKGGLNSGFDGDKKGKVKKRHIIVNTLNLLLVVLVDAANSHDGKATFEAFEKLKAQFYSVAKVFADTGYKGESVDNIKIDLNSLLLVNRRTDKEEKFKVLPNT